MPVLDLPSRRLDLQHAILERQRSQSKPGWSEAKEDREVWATWLLGAALCAAASERGFDVVTSPGEGILLHGAKGTFQPSAIVEGIAAGTVTAESWSAQCRQLGLEGLELEPGDAPH